MIARVVLAALALAGSPALAQGAADAKLCASVKAIMAKTPTTAWPDKPNVTLEWDGGSNPCVTRAGVLVCDFFNTQMASGDLCKIFRAPEPGEIQRDAAARTYAQTRSMPALQACFTGATSERWEAQATNRASGGMTVKLQDGSTFRFGETNTRLELGDSICGFNSVGFEFDPAK